MIVLRCLATTLTPVGGGGLACRRVTTRELSALARVVLNPGKASSPSTTMWNVERVIRLNRHQASSLILLSTNRCLLPKTIF